MKEIVQVIGRAGAEVVQNKCRGPEVQVKRCRQGAGGAGADGAERMLKYRYAHVQMYRCAEEVLSAEVLRCKRGDDVQRCRC